MGEGKTNHISLQIVVISEFIHFFVFGAYKNPENGA